MAYVYSYSPRKGKLDVFKLKDMEERPWGLYIRYRTDKATHVSWQKAPKEGVLDVQTGTYRIWLTERDDAAVMARIRERRLIDIHKVLCGYEEKMHKLREERIIFQNDEMEIDDGRL